MKNRSLLSLGSRLTGCAPTFEWRQETQLQLAASPNRTRSLTSLDGTHKGVPSFTMPLSTITPKTIGSRVLKMNCDRTHREKGNYENKECIENKKRCVLTVENYLRKDAQLARKNGNILKFFSLLCLQLVTIFHKTVKQMIDDISLENLHSQRIGHFLSVTFNFHIKGQDNSIPTFFFYNNKYIRSCFREVFS